MRTFERNNEFERTITRRGETEISHLIQRYCERLLYGIIILTKDVKSDKSEDSDKSEESGGDDEVNNLLKTFHFSHQITNLESINSTNQ